MLKRIYVDNFRCLVNFELKLDRVNLLLGGNGTGKSTVFDVLHRLQQCLAGNARILAAFPGAELTRWQSSTTQRLELDLQAGEAEYSYALLIEHDEDRRKAKIKSETLLLGGQKLFDFQDGKAYLFHDDFSPGPDYPFDWTLSGVGVLQPRPDNKKLTRFRQAVANLVIASPHPTLMASASQQDENSLSRRMENFVSWYRYLSQEHQGALLELFQEIKKVIPGFSSFSVKEAGEAKVLKVLLERPGGGGRPLPYDFSELSDGQRVLVALYALLFGLKGEGASLFLDEPENFVALREIQPWLSTLIDSCGEGIEQAVLISHHPEITDHLALAPSGRWFERDQNGPVRVREQPNFQVEGLRPSEVLARGWQS